MVNLKLVANTLQSLKGSDKLLGSICARARIAAVVAVTAILLCIFLAKVVEQSSAAAHTALGIRLRFE